MPDPSTDRSLAGAWLDYLYGDVEDGWLTLFSLDRSTGERYTDWFSVDDLDKAATRAIGRSSTCCVWFGVATRTERLVGKRGGAEHCAHVPALWVDVDVADEVHAAEGLPADRDEAHKIIDAFPIPPTAVVDSGHGLQAWWVLAEPADADDVARVLPRWNATWQALAAPHHIDNVFDLPRIMRLPGTLNRKTEPAAVKIIEADWDRLHDLSDLDEELRDPPAPEPRTTRRQWTGNEGLPGQVFSETHTGGEILARMGFELDHTDTLGEHWRRPGKTKGQGSSATVYAEDGHTTIWSDTVTARFPALEVRRPYDPFGLYACVEHSGDHRAAAAELERQGYGTLSINELPADEALFSEGLRNSRPRPEGEGLPVRYLPVLPPEFWEERECFAAIRDAAAQWLCSPDATLAAVLCRVAAFTSHEMVIPPRLGPPTGLSLIVAMAGASGTGKSKAERLAATLIPAPAEMAQMDGLPLGSGEGLVETMFEVRTEKVDGKTVTVKEQVRHNAFVYADEGRVLTELASRSGSTLTSTLRSIFSGATIGQANASRETHRNLPAGSYVFGVLLGIQPRAAMDLFGELEVAAGTTQRFLWSCAQHPDIGALEPVGAVVPLERPEMGTLDNPLTSIGGIRPIDTPDVVFDEVRARLIARGRGDAQGSELDTHRDLLRLKVMGTLALLEGRQEATGDDWRLAGMIMDNSDEVRRWVQDSIAAVLMDARRAEGRRAAAKQAQVEADQERRAFDSAVRSVVNRANRDTSVTVSRRELSHAVAGKHRALVDLDEVIDKAVSTGGITPSGDGWKGTK